MKPCFVLNEDERKIRHEKRTTKCSNNKKISNEEQTSSSNMAICRSPEDIFTMDDMLFILGTIHILRKQRGWMGGVSQMLTFAYFMGGWIKANAYVSKV